MAETPMSLRAALELLGLDPNSQLDDQAIEQAYRRCAPAAHPDRGATRSTWDSLQEARRVALAACEGIPPPPHGMELVRPGGVELDRLSTRDIALTSQRDLALIRLGQEAAETERRVIRRRTSRLAREKRQAWVVAFFAALATAVFQVVRAVAPDAANEFTIAGAVLVAGATLLGAWFKLRADNITQAIEDFAAMLGDFDAHEALLEHIAAAAGMHEDFGAGRWWPRATLEEALDRWSSGRHGLSSDITAPYRAVGLLPRADSPPALAAVVGPVDAAELLIAKALESGALEQARGGNGRQYAWRHRSA